MSQQAAAANNSRARITPEEKRTLFAILLRSEMAIRAMVDLLDPLEFAKIDAMYALPWSCVRDYWLEHKKVLSPRALITEVKARLRRDPDYMSERGKHKLLDFLRFSLSLVNEDLDADYALVKARAYLQDRLHDRYRSVFASKDSTVDLETVSEDLRRRAAQISHFEINDDLPDAIPEEIAEEKTERAPLGRSFFDAYLDGGICRQEVLTFMAPYGTAKTLLAVDIAACQGEYWLSQHRQNLTPSLGLVFYFSYEEPLSELQIRLISNAAQIPRNRVKGKLANTLAKREDGLQEYERELFASQIRSGIPVPGEYERLTAARARTTNVIFKDMTGLEKGESSKVGTGLYTEIYRSICKTTEAYEKKHKVKAHPAMVIVDYADAAIERYVHAKGLDPIKAPYPIRSSFIYNFKNQVLYPLNAAGFVLNQLSGEENAKAPGVPAHHTGAKGAKNFAENANFAIQMSNPRPDGLAVIACTKARRNAQMPHRVVEIQGRFGRVLDVDDRWTIDPRTKRLLQRDEADQADRESASNVRFRRPMPVPGARRRVIRD